MLGKKSAIIGRVMSRRHKNVKDPNILNLRERYNESLGRVIPAIEVAMNIGTGK